MKKIIGMIIIAIIFSYLLFSISDPIFKKKSPIVHQGVIDLRSWDFEEDDIVSLLGEWEYYDEQLLTPEDFDNSADELPKLTGYNMPLSQRNNLIKRVGYTEKGYGTYRLVIKTNVYDEYYSVKIKNEKNYATNKLYVNGERLGLNGDNEDWNTYEKTNESPPHVFFLHTLDQVDIILQVSNFYRPFSLDEYNMVFGRQKDFQIQETVSTAIDLSGTALCFIIALYYMSLYYGKPTDQSIKYSIIEFLSLGLFFLFSGKTFVYCLLPGISSNFVIKISRITHLGITYSVAGLTNKLNKKIVSDRMFKVIQVGFLVYSFILLLTPYGFSKNMLQFTYVPTLIPFIYMIIKTVQVIYRDKQKGDIRNILFVNMISMICILTCIYNSYLFGWGIVSNEIIGSIAVIVFILLSQLTLAFRFIVNQERLMEAERAKEEFFVKSSYILKAPLNSILKTSESIIHNKDDDTITNDVISDKAKVIKNITYDLLHVINATLDATLLQNNQLKLSKSQLDVKICIELVVNNIKKSELSRGVDIIIDVSEGLIFLGDEARIRQIIHNLVINAIYSIGSSQQYMSGKGYDVQNVITIKGRSEKSIIHISVLDKGCGILKEHQREIFKPYVTYHSEGIGLGLYISNLLAKHMDGILRLEWSEIGKGSCFVLELPSSKEEYVEHISDKLLENHKEAYTLPIYHGVMNKGQAKTILIVDDELFNIQIANDILASEGYHIASAYSGDEALEIIKTIKIDLVILDIMMPGISGIETCKSIRKKYSIIELPIILTTSVSVNNDFNLSLQAEANDIITKPFIDNELKVRVQTLIALKTSIEDATKNELAFLQAQIKPHFIYNTINTIISFCYTDSERAASLLTNFSQYLRLTFDIDNINMFIPIRREIELVKAYVEIQNARFADRFKVTYNIDSLLLERDIPSLMIQPLVENAIKHGFYQPEGLGHINITIKEADDRLTIIVNDTGVGMSTEKVESLNNMKYKTGGVGIWNIKKRISKIKDATMLIESIQNIGTTVTIIIILQ